MLKRAIGLKTSYGDAFGKLLVFVYSLNSNEKQIFLKLSRIVAECDMYFNLDNEEYLFTIIEKRRKRITKSESVLRSQTLSLFDFIYLIVKCACLSEHSDDTCIKTSTRLSAKLCFLFKYHALIH